MHRLDAYGRIEPGRTDRTFVRNLFRETLPAYLHDLLIKWERFGYLSWSVEPTTPQDDHTTAG
jgi:hypothetical protein